MLKSGGTSAGQSTDHCPNGAVAPSNVMRGFLDPACKTTIDRVSDGSATRFERDYIARGGTIINVTPMERFEAQWALDEWARKHAVECEDHNGLMPYDEGYAGFLHLPDVDGRPYFDIAYEGPDPAAVAQCKADRLERETKVIDLAAYRARKQGAPPMADVIPLEREPHVGDAGRLQRRVA